jgi:hypothetical protein
MATEYASTEPNYQRYQNQTNYNGGYNGGPLLPQAQQPQNTSSSIIRESHVQQSVLSNQDTSNSEPTHRSEQLYALQPVESNQQYYAMKQQQTAQPYQSG